MGPSLDEQLAETLRHYALEVSAHRVLQDKPAKPVWRLSTDVGEVILKRVPGSEALIRFIVHAVGHMQGRGLDLPSVVPTRTGQGYALVGEGCWVATEFVRGHKLDIMRSSDRHTLVEGMARFHRASRGVRVPAGARAKDLRGRWHESFAERRTKLAALRDRAAAQGGAQGFDALFLAHAERWLAQIDRAAALLRANGYDAWVEQLRREPMLCHQDYTGSNTRLARGGRVFAFDLDSVAFDLPARDLRKIINKVMKKQGHYQADQVLAMLRAYERIEPLTSAQRGVLAATLSFPHLAYGQITKYYEGREPSWSYQKQVDKLTLMTQVEKSKEETIRALLGGTGAAGPPAPRRRGAGRARAEATAGGASALCSVARQVLGAHWPHLEVGEVEVIQGEPVKAVWRVQTNLGPVCLKRQGKSPERVAFTAAAQRYVAGRGGRVPQLVLTAAGQTHGVHQRRPFVAYRWVEGTPCDMERSWGMLRRGVEGLADFQRATEGFVAPAGVAVSSEVGTWPAILASRVEHLAGWRRRALDAEGEDARRLAPFVALVEPGLRAARLALELLERSGYSAWCAHDGPRHLTHRDFGKGNALDSPQGVWILDLDNLSFDVPTHDLRKLITKWMTKRRRWDAEQLVSIVSWYRSSFPLDPCLEELLAIDLLFPHALYGAAKNLFIKGKGDGLGKIRRLARLHPMKLAALSHLEPRVAAIL